MPAPDNAGDRATVELLVTSYLAKAGVLTPSLQRQHQLPGDKEVLNALLALASEYEARFERQLNELIASWDVGDGMAQQSARGSFTDVLDVMFSDGCNWGRVVTVFIFAGLLARRYPSFATPDELRDWTVAYLSSERLVATWIREHGGWTGLVKFYGDGSAAAAPDQLASETGTFRRLLTAAGAAGAGIAFFTIKSLLTNRA